MYYKKQIYELSCLTVYNTLKNFHIYKISINMGMDIGSTGLFMASQNTINTNNKGYFSSLPNPNTMINPMMEQITTYGMLGSPLR